MRLRSCSVISPSPSALRPRLRSRPKDPRVHKASSSSFTISLPSPCSFSYPGRLHTHDACYVAAFCRPRHVPDALSLQISPRCILHPRPPSPAPRASDKGDPSSYKRRQVFFRLRYARASHRFLVSEVIGSLDSTPCLTYK